MTLVGGCARSWLLAAAVPVAAAALAACGGGGDETFPAATAPSTTATVTETGPATTAEQTATAETETEDETPAQTDGDGSAGERADAVIVIENGAPVGGPAEVKVGSGDSVRIVVRADAEQELHLHGYEIEKTVRPGKPAIFAFPAELEGVFELETHLGDTLVAKLLVEP